MSARASAAADEFREATAPRGSPFMSDSEGARSLDALGRALDRLREALAEPEANPLAVDGTIQRFEFAFPEMERTYRSLRERRS
jgi:hypothetical protein